MKNKFLILYAFFVTTTPVFNQDINYPNYDKSNSVFIKTGAMNWSSEFGLLSITANYERLIKAGKVGYVAFSIGAGPMIGINDYSGTYPIVQIGTNAILGKKNHFAELGVGLSMTNGNVLVDALIGYRLIVGQRIMFVPLCKYDIISNSMGFAFGLGYRFKSKKNQSK